jgi:Ca2+-binding RTX toxin-like protein
MEASGNRNRLVGDFGDDVLDGTAAAIAGEEGSDAFASQTLESRGGNDRLNASATAEVFVTATAVASNTLGGGDGNDQLEAFAEARAAISDLASVFASNVLQGGSGDDRLIATALASGADEDRGARFKRRKYPIGQVRRRLPGRSCCHERQYK